MDVYCVTTETATFTLDEKGVCLRVVAIKGVLNEAHRRIRGAQYVACMDPDQAAKLLPMPRIGSTVLFAKLSEDGIALLQAGTVLRFRRVDQHEEAPKEKESAKAAEKARAVLPPVLPKHALQGPQAPVSAETKTNVIYLSDHALQRSVEKAKVDTVTAVVQPEGFGIDLPKVAKSLVSLQKTGTGGVSIDATLDGATREAPVAPLVKGPSRR
ncbi:MAG: hypothetical protein KBF88_05025 [Polyangiaceae bacterium]|nr:hypothetical protein [Polyangiaceae bacterium]